jgi:glycosyltransferase 2 family protein
MPRISPSALLKYLIYLSVLFAVAALLKLDLLTLPRQVEPVPLALALVLVLAGFLIEVLPWRIAVCSARTAITPAEALWSLGLPIFGKYIPGKIWLLVGRAVLVADQHQVARAALVTASLNNQLIALWCGLALGSLALLGTPELRGAGWLLIGGLALLATAILTDGVNVATNQLLRVLRRTAPELPRLRPGVVAAIAPWYLAQWVCWCLGFWLLCAALMATTPGWLTGPAFALAATLGLLALVAPGGIGVREGVLAAVLTAGGIGLTEAGMIAVAARLWFLVGEAGIFALALVARRRELG